jgi:hypothetical protein
MNCLPSAPEQHRAFKLIFVPLLIFSLVGQLAVVWTQLIDIRDGYFDFVMYYSAAQILNDGNGAQLYDLKVQREYQKEFGAREKRRDLPFNHPPYELLALLGLAKFSFPVAHALWAGINTLLLGVILGRLFQFVEAEHRIVFTLMLFAYFPTITTLKMGQDSIITTFLLVETFASLKRKQYALAGGVLAFGLYKPQFVLPIAGIFLLHRRWSSILGFLFTGLLLGVISLAMVGWDGLRGLVSLWLPMTQRGHVVWPELMTNLRGLAYMTLDLGGLSGATNILTLGLSILVYIVTLRLWPRSADEGSGLFDLRFALAVVMTALVSFHLYSYDGTLLAISLIIMLNRVLNRPRPYPVWHVVFLVILVVLFLPLVPNVLLGTAILAWWGLPLPVLFCVMAMEIRRGSAVETETKAIVA